MRTLAFDIESTGLDPLNDRIVELVVVDVEDREVVFSSLFKPSIPIEEAAYETHGISAEMLAEAPGFEERAAEVQALVEGVRLLGYGSFKFDTVILDAELRRAGEDGIDFDTLEEIDLLQVWKKSEPRTLQGAVERFLHRTLDGAHRAEIDSIVLPDLQHAMKQEWNLDDDDLVELTGHAQSVDRAGKLRYDDREGEVVFAFGQYAGEPIRQHQDYLDWILDAEFPTETKQVIRQLRRRNFKYP